jgi:phage pi2 protein 07
MSAEEAPTIEGVSVEALTRAYLKLREKRAELKASFDVADTALEADQTKLKRALLDHCKEHGVDSVRTSAGLFYRQTKTRYWTNDWESMNKFIMDNGVPHFYEKRLNQTSVREFLEENPDLLPPGLNVDSEYVITVRKK